MRAAITLANSNPTAFNSEMGMNPIDTYATNTYAFFPTTFPSKQHFEIEKLKNELFEASDRVLEASLKLHGLAYKLDELDAEIARVLRQLENYNSCLIQEPR